MSHILRYFGKLGFTQSVGWVPHTPMIQNQTVFGSYWPVGKESMWTLVNRGTETADGPQIELEAAEFEQSRFYDCYHGRQISVRNVANGRLQLSLQIEGLGLGCVFATAQPTAELVRMSAMTKLPLAHYSAELHTVLQQRMLPTKRITNGSHDQVPAGMVRLPSCDKFEFESTGVEIEPSSSTNTIVGVDVQFPFESVPKRTHSHTLQMPALLFDKYPVTCKDYQIFLNHSSYTPTRSSHAWLQNWDWKATAGSQPLQPKLSLELEMKPATYVSYSEAAAYCKAVGKRLPQTTEWQYAAQGNTSRRFPWGDLDDAACRPELSEGRTIPGAMDVDAFGENCSSVFNVWIRPRRELLGIHKCVC